MEEHLLSEGMRFILYLINNFIKQSFFNLGVNMYVYLQGISWISLECPGYY